MLDIVLGSSDPGEKEKRRDVDGTGTGLCVLPC